MNKNETKIHKFNFFYLLLKLYQLLVFNSYYKRVEVIGKNNIPKRTPLIFTPNHQNALMDALIVHDTCGLSPVFLARADIFKKRRQRNVLHFLKMLPVYRMRDGADELSKNDDTFNICIDILEDCYSVCLMPEGNHGHQRRLRTLVKGTFRIAFQAQEKFGDKNSVKIVPVGLDFEHYQKIQQDLLVIYGKPIEVSDYIEAYRENPPRAINALKERLANELKKLIIQIDSTDHYDLYQEMRDIFNSRMRNLEGILGDSLYEKFRADKKMIELMDKSFKKDPGRIERLSQKVAEYTAGMQKLNLRNWVIEKRGFSIFRIVIQSLLLFVYSPIFIAGWISNIIPFSIPVRMTKKVKDPQFVSSFKFGIAMALFLIYYILTGVIVGLFLHSVWISLSILAAMYLCGHIALYYLFSLKKLIAAIRYRFLKNKGNRLINRVIELYKEIITEMETLISDTKREMTS